MYQLTPNMQPYVADYVAYVAQCLYIDNTAPVGFDDFTAFADTNMHMGAHHINLVVSKNPQPIEATPRMVSALTGMSEYEAQKIQKFDSRTVPPSLQTTLITHAGKTQPLAQWAAELGIGVETMTRRYAAKPNDVAYVLRPRYKREA